MGPLVADTHSALWFLSRDKQLSEAARTAMRATLEEGQRIFVSAISVVEVTYLVEKRRLPAEALERLTTALTDDSSGFKVAPLDLQVAVALAFIPRAIVPDLPDRVVAATALALRCPLVTRDAQIRAANLDTIW